MGSSSAFINIYKRKWYLIYQQKMNSMTTLDLGMGHVYEFIGFASKHIFKEI